MRQIFEVVARNRARGEDGKGRNPRALRAKLLDGSLIVGLALSEFEGHLVRQLLTM